MCNSLYLLLFSTTVVQGHHGEPRQQRPRPEPQLVHRSRGPGAVARGNGCHPGRGMDGSLWGRIQLGRQTVQLPPRVHGHGHDLLVL
jgi:hypothetical protein